MNTRIREVRKVSKISQEEFGKSLGLSRQYITLVETGERIPSDRTIRDICRIYGVNETWLRTGAGEMVAPKSRQQEMAELTRSLMEDSPESFRSALVTALLRFDPNGPEWAILERIYDSIAKEAEQSKPKEEPNGK